MIMFCSSSEYVRSTSHTRTGSAAESAIPVDWDRRTVKDGPAWHSMGRDDTEYVIK
jgi:hypothetical protein